MSSSPYPSVSWLYASTYNRQRQETERFQSLFHAHQGGESADGFRIFGIAAERDGRHLQMVADEEFDLGARFSRQVEAIEDATRQADAFRHVRLVARLADVVQQQRQHQPLRVFEVLQERREALAPT